MSDTVHTYIGGDASPSPTPLFAQQPFLPIQLPAWASKPEVLVAAIVCTGVLLVLAMTIQNLSARVRLLERMLSRF